jgi:phosphoribosylanthranilate isomerase
MSLRTLVKVSNVTNLSDARYCAGMGVEWLGFSMDELVPERVAEMRGWVAGVRIVGETAATDADRIAGLVERFQPDVLEITQASLLPHLKSLGTPLALRLDVATLSAHDVEQELGTAQGQVEYALLTSSDEFARLETADFDRLDRLAFRYPILLGYGLRESNLDEVLRDVPLRGVAFTGGDEPRPGYLNSDELMTMLELLEED